MDHSPKFEKKCWGWVRHEFYSDDVGLSRLELDPNFRCSCHYHKERINQFTTIKGKICIEWWPGGLDRPSKMCVLSEGETFLVPVGVWHRFRTMAGGRVIELYWPDDVFNKVQFDDIVREDEGGADDPVELERDLEMFG